MQKGFWVKANNGCHGRSEIENRKEKMKRKVNIDQDVKRRRR